MSYKGKKINEVAEKAQTLLYSLDTTEALQNGTLGNVDYHLHMMAVTKTWDDMKEHAHGINSALKKSPELASKYQELTDFVEYFK